MNASKLGRSPRELPNDAGQRALPSRPSLEHLKSQAKDLLAAQRRGEVEALTRIRAAVPAYANQSDDAIRTGSFALHDAQSAIAREYGFPSWAALRTHVESASAPLEASTGEAPRVDELALMQALTGRGLPPELDAQVRKALERRGTAQGRPTPPRLPVLPLRNAVAFTGAVFPINVARPSTLRAIDAALASDPPLLAVFSQRAIDIETPSADDLHPTGCSCQLLFVHRSEQGAWILLEGVRWVELEGLEQVDPYYLARVSDARHVPAPSGALGDLDRTLRERARRLSGTLPPGLREQALSLIDATKDTVQLADLVMANLDASVDEKAAYVGEADVVRKVERLIAQLEAALERSAPTG
ncbi:MAG TPA: LON peptidase substrate-binding domain-containing protein [Polyangiaceae bacterium]|nr:LON peptidase substrate-binding domain-containing protein [Polyangiaceae bacterium]